MGHASPVQSITIYDQSDVARSKERPMDHRGNPKKSYDYKY